MQQEDYFVTFKTQKKHIMKGDFFPRPEQREVSKLTLIGQWLPIFEATLDHRNHNQRRAAETCRPYEDAATLYMTSYEPVLYVASAIALEYFLGPLAAVWLG